MSSDPPLPNTTSIDTDGGTVVDGAVNTGGDFVGRDQTIHGDQIARDKIIGAGDIHIYNYPPTSTSTSPSADEAPAPGDPPYQGMAYYDVADADRFFGREALMAALVDHLRHNNLLAVIGASGSGKSSLVRAGLLPALQGKQPLRDGKQPPTGSARWAYHLITPTAHPLKTLAASLTPANESILAQAQLMDALRVERRSLDLYAHRLVRGDQRLLLVVDQFEELFTLCKDDGEQQAFVDNLLHAATDDGVVTLVLTLRADFYHHCARFPDLRTALERQQKYIGAMTRDELRRAIEEPANAGKWELQAGLVEQLLHDVGDEPGALPLLSHALLETWQRRRGRTLTLAGYRAAGGVQGAIAKTADDVFNRFTDEQKTIARIIFLRLTELGEGVQDTRRRVRPAELKLTHAGADEVQDVLGKLTKARLVTTDIDEIQVAHEALIRNWGTLREWLDDNREGNRIQRRLTEAADQWLEFGKDTTLLYRGVLLQQAQEWLRSTIEPPNQQEMEFLQVSEGEVAAQVKRELEQARTLAAAQQRRAQTSRWAAIIISVFFLLAAIAAFWGFNRQHIANQKAQELEEQTAIAQSRALSLQAQQQKPNAPMLSWLLAIEAIKKANSLEALGVLQPLLPWPALPLTQLRHDGPVFGAAWNPQETQIFTWSWDVTARLWDADTGKQLFVIKLNDGLRGARWNSTGERILTWGNSYDRTARIWDAANGNLLFSLPHDEPLNGATWNKDETRILTWSEDGTTCVWDAFNGQSLFCILPDNTNYGRGATWNRDETRILTWGISVRVWDATNGQPLFALPLNNIDSLSGAAWNKDGTLILTWGGSDNMTRIWNASNGEQLLILPQDSSVYEAAWSSDEMRIATGGIDGNVHIWDATSGKQLAVLPHFDSIYGILWNADSSRILTWTDNNSAHIWDTASGRQLFTLQHLNERHSFINGAAWNSNESLILTWGRDGTARLWQADSGKSVLSFQHDGDVDGTMWNRDESKLLTWSKDGTARLWDVSTQGYLLTPNYVDVMKWNNDESRLLIVDGDSIHLWNVLTGQQILSLQHNSWFDDAIWNNDESRILTWSRDSIVRLWDAISGELLMTFQHDDILSQYYPDLGINGVSWSKDESRILTWADDGTARIWSVSTGEELLSLQHDDSVLKAQWNNDESRILTESEGGIISISGTIDGKKFLTLQDNERVLDPKWNDDESRILARSSDGSAKIWDTTNGSLLLTFRHDSSFSEAQWTGDESRILTWSDDGSIQIWDAIDGKQLLLFQHDNVINGAMWNVDSSRLLTWSNDNTARIWDTVDGKQLLSLQHDYRVFDAQWNDKEDLLLSRTQHNAFLWDASNGTLLRIFQGDGLPLVDMRWSQNGHEVLLATIGGTIYRYEMHAKTLLEWACKRTTRNFTWAEWNIYLEDIQGVYRPTCPNAPIPPDAIVAIQEEAHQQILAGQVLSAAQRLEELNGWLQVNGQFRNYGVDVEAFVAKVSATATAAVLSSPTITRTITPKPSAP